MKAKVPIDKNSINKTRKSTRSKDQTQTTEQRECKRELRTERERTVIFCFKAMSDFELTESNHEILRI